MNYYLDENDQNDMIELTKPSFFPIGIQSIWYSKRFKKSLPDKLIQNISEICPKYLNIQYEFSFEVTRSMSDRSDSTSLDIFRFLSCLNSNCELNICYKYAQLNSFKMKFCNVYVKILKDDNTSMIIKCKVLECTANLEKYHNLRILETERKNHLCDFNNDSVFKFKDFETINDEKELSIINDKYFTISSIQNFEVLVPLENCKEIELNNIKTKYFIKFIEENDIFQKILQNWKIKWYIDFFNKTEYTEELSGEDELVNL